MSLWCRGNIHNFFTRHILQHFLVSLSLYLSFVATICPQVVNYENKAMCHLNSTILLLSSKMNLYYTIFNGWLKLQFFIMFCCMNKNIKNSHFSHSLNFPARFCWFCINFHSLVRYNVCQQNKQKPPGNSQIYIFSIVIFSLKNSNQHIMSTHMMKTYFQLYNAFVW